MRRWLALGYTTALVWATIPVGPDVVAALRARAWGSWLLGSGVAVVAGLVLAAVAGLLAGRRRPALAWGALALALAALAGAWRWLALLPPERLHLIEYALIGWLCWLAVSQHLRAAWGAWATAFALAIALGWTEELLQGATPGRYYDVRDVGQNVLGAGIGLLVAAATDARLLAGGAPRREAA